MLGCTMFFYEFYLETNGIIGGSGGNTNQTGMVINGSFYSCIWQELEGELWANCIGKEV